MNVNRVFLRHRKENLDICVDCFLGLWLEKDLLRILCEILFIMIAMELATELN
jgi:hypothetical protein